MRKTALKSYEIVFFLKMIKCRKFSVTGNVRYQMSMDCPHIIW